MKKQNIPIYTVDEPSQSGIYLALFHGRKRPNAQLSDWGFNGPLIGPLKDCHTTYAAHIKLSFIKPEDSRKYGFNPENMIDLNIIDGMVVFDGKYYGDWRVFCHDNLTTHHELERSHRSFLKRFGLDKLIGGSHA